MNVKELIRALEEYPKDMKVVVRGYESGVNDVENLSSYDVFLNCNTEWYYGKHECAEYYYGSGKDFNVERVVEICG
ncbi:MAG: hypothetical protein U9Q40_03170 [Campylobacterota bacterium]|nr:hypothetical protein [Campylobacterota bacterium]